MMHSVDIGVGDVSVKGDAGIVATALLVISEMLGWADAWLGAHSHLVVSGTAILVAASTIWYHRSMINQRIRDRKLEHEKHEWEKQKAEKEG